MLSTEMEINDIPGTLSIIKMLITVIVSKLSFKNYSYNTLLNTNQELISSQDKKKTSTKDNSCQTDHLECKINNQSNPETGNELSMVNSKTRIKFTITIQSNSYLVQKTSNESINLSELQSDSIRTPEFPLSTNLDQELSLTKSYLSDKMEVTNLTPIGTSSPFKEQVILNSQHSVIVRISILNNNYI